jgi:hypothetical protein
MNTALRPTQPANTNVAPEADDPWREHCLQMAYSTEAMADWCDDAEMSSAYLALAAKWKTRAAQR